MGQVLYDLAAWTAAAALGRVLGGAGAILMLHRVRPATWTVDPGASITPETFLALVARLRALGHEIVSLDEALVRLESGGPRFACLTFDDGYRDNHDVLWALARTADVPIAVYLTTGYIDGSAPAWWLLLETLISVSTYVTVDGITLPCASDAEKTATYRTLAGRLSHDPAAARTQVLTWVAAQDRDPSDVTGALFMDWPMIAGMAVDPLVTFGAHTMSHPHLAALSEQDARNEIFGCRTHIAEKLGVAPRHFAYPFGKAEDFGPREESIVRAAGFASAVRAFGGPVKSPANPMALPRIGFGGNDTVANLSLRVSGVRALLKAG